MKSILGIFPLIFLFSCSEPVPVYEPNDEVQSTEPYLIILGNVQDAGSPQVGCEKECCKELFDNPDPYRRVVALGLIDHSAHKQFLFEATPDFPQQMGQLNAASGIMGAPDGIFLSHAHIGHYSGLMYLGKEAMYAKEVPVHVMPGMRDFLINNGPWDKLVQNKNIVLRQLAQDSLLALTNSIKVEPILVPHRDEYSETVGFIISGPNKRALFIPDIDKWSKWEKDIIDLISEVDYALIDGTFYDGNELPGRDINEVPHPFVKESCKLFDTLPLSERNKIYFIHFNHTNPLLDPTSSESRSIEQNGYHIARINEKLKL